MKANEAWKIVKKAFEKYVYSSGVYLATGLHNMLSTQPGTCYVETKEIIRIDVREKNNH